MSHALTPPRARHRRISTGPWLTKPHTDTDTCALTHTHAHTMPSRAPLKLEAYLKSPHKNFYTDHCKYDKANRKDVRVCAFGVHACVNTHVDLIFPKNRTKILSPNIRFVKGIHSQS